MCTNVLKKSSLYLPPNGFTLYGIQFSQIFTNGHFIISLMSNLIELDFENFVRTNCTEF